MRAGAAHHEAAWARRLPGFFAFLLDPMREASPLAQDLFPPRLDLGPNGSGGFDLRYMSLFGARQTIGRGPSLTDWSWEPEPMSEIHAPID